MTNHEMIASALKPFKGKALATSEIREIVSRAFPSFNMGSMLPNDHAEGNKSPCWCAVSNSQIFERVSRGVYLVR